MKSISVLVAAASIAVLAAACSKKDEPVTSETNTTSAPIVQDQPVVAPPPAAPEVTTGTMTTTTGANMVQKGRDAGIATDYPTGGSDLMDRDHSSFQNNGVQNGSSMPADQGQQPSMDKTNHSTPLGDSKSGTYTDNKGTHGGKATWGTGPKKDTKMDQPTK